jgi:hypothetical protein
MCFFPCVSIYRAEDMKLKRLVAVKFLRESLSHNEIALERFQREARGAYDMTGNVGEWCWNEAPNGRCICSNAGVHGLFPDRPPSLSMGTSRSRMARKDKLPHRPSDFISTPPMSVRSCFKAIGWLLQRIQPVI